MNNVLILQWLSNTNIPLSVIARKTKITRKSLHNWRNGSNPSHRSLLKLTEFYNSSVSVENESNKLQLGNDGNIDKDYVLKLQQEKIEALEKESAKINAEEIMWDSVPYDFEHKLQIKWHISNPFKLQRAYIELSNIKLCSKKLGYTEEELQEFYQPHKFYLMNEHPVDNILSEKSKSELKETTKKTYGIVNKLRMLGSKHFIPMSLSFKHKKGHSVPASSFIRVNSNLIVEAKTKFI